MSPEAYSKVGNTPLDWFRRDKHSLCVDGFGDGDPANGSVPQIVLNNLYFGQGTASNTWQDANDQIGGAGDPNPDLS